MVIFNSYVKLPEGKVQDDFDAQQSVPNKSGTRIHQIRHWQQCEDRPFHGTQEPALRNQHSGSVLVASKQYIYIVQISRVLF